MSASSMAMNEVQNYALSSMRAAVNSQDSIARLFKGVTDDQQAEIKQAAQIAKDTYSEEISKGSHGRAQFQRLKRVFKTVYEGTLLAKDVASIAWQHYNFLP
jgi:hypothetical protein